MHSMTPDIIPINSPLKPALLTEAELELLKTGTLQLLDEVGVHFPSDRCLKIFSDHGARVDAIIPEKVDRGGAINLISPYNITSKNCAGMATSGYLVEVARISMDRIEEWRQQYPKAFEKEYDPASGLRFNAWTE